MTRAALYARYSSDQQSACPIEDQLRICRKQAIRNGWQIANDYTDAAISGSSIVLRLGIRELLEDAQPRRFEIVVAEPRIA